MSEFGVSIDRESVEEGARRIATFGVSGAEASRLAAEGMAEFEKAMDRIGTGQLRYDWKGQQ